MGVRSQPLLPPKLDVGPADIALPDPLLQSPHRSPISLPPAQSGLAMPLPGGLQLQAVTSSPTSSWPGMGKRNRRMRKLKEKKKKKRQDRQEGPPPQFLKCNPHHPKSPHGQREGREGISAPSIKGL